MISALSTKVSDEGDGGDVTTWIKSHEVHRWMLKVGRRVSSGRDLNSILKIEFCLQELRR